MPTYTYPVPRASGTLTAAQVQLLLANPRVIAKRVASLVDQKFISDFLLTGRFEAKGGGIFYETGEQIFTADAPEAVEPGAEYPLTVMTRGDLAAAKTVKWGLDSKVTDESIARLGQNPVDRALARLANSVIKNVDSVAMSVIGSKVTQTQAATGTWTTVANVVGSVLSAQATADGLALGIDLDTIALSGAQYAKVMALFASAGVLPRESDGNPLLNGNYPINLLGYTWVTSPWLIGTDPYFLDRDQLGGMADEDLGSPGYARAPRPDGVGIGVESKTIREDENDQWRLRARRVTVPVVLEARAGMKITGTGL